MHGCIGHIILITLLLVAAGQQVFGQGLPLTVEDFLTDRNRLRLDVNLGYADNTRENHSGQQRETGENLSASKEIAQELPLTTASISTVQDRLPADFHSDNFNNSKERTA